MPTYYDWIYLSPHLDDAALSCGGQIYRYTQAGQRVLIVSVMAGDPPGDAVSDYAHSLHTRWALATEATAARRAEDVAACARLGAEPLHWEVPDCIYRHEPATGFPFYVSDADIFGEIAPPEQALVADLAARLAALPAHGTLVAPLAVGHHVDHQLIRQAVAQSCNLARVRFYEDYPYSQQPGALAAALGPTPQAWAAEVVALDADALAAKTDAVAAFASQLSTFFVDRADLDAQIEEYAAAVGGERRWRWTGEQGIRW